MLVDWRRIGDIERRIGEILHARTFQILSYFQHRLA